MKENSYPVDERGKPNLSYYSDPPEYYAEMHAQAMRDARDRTTDSAQAFGRRVHACWGLIAKGPDGVAIALDMLRSSDSEAREDAAGILAEVGRDEAVVGQLLQSLNSDSDVQARDGIIQALGAMRSRAALPELVKLVEDEATDGDTRWTAIEALGKVARRRFLDRPDPIAAAAEWISTARRRGTLKD